MENITVMFQTDTTTLSALRKISRDQDIPLNDLICDALKRDLYRRTKAKTSQRTDERLVAPLRALLADDFAFAQSWDDLIARIRSKGYDLRASGGGIAVFDPNSNARVAKGSDLGASYGRMMRKFGAPMPGHGHQHLTDRVLGAHPPQGALSLSQRAAPSGATSVRNPNRR